MGSDNFPSDPWQATSPSAVPPPPPTPNAYLNDPSNSTLQPTSTSRNRLAISALGIAILAWLAIFIRYGNFVLLVGCVVAIVLGVVARRQIKASAGRQTGSKAAMAGIVIGIIGAVLSLALSLAAFLSRWL
jgi:hypothetical protein